MSIVPSLRNSDPGIKSKLLKTQLTLLTLTLIILQEATLVSWLLLEYINALLPLFTLCSQILATLPSQVQTPVQWSHSFTHSTKAYWMNFQLPSASKKTWFLPSRSSQTVWGKHMELNHCDTNTKQYNSGIYKAYRGRSSRVCQWGGNVIWGFRKEEGSRIVSRITSSRKERRTFHAEVISLHQYCSPGIYSPHSSQRVLSERQIPQCHFPLLQTKPTTTNKKSWRAPRPTCILPITPHSSEAILLLCCSMCSSYVVFAFLLSTHPTAKCLHLLQYSVILLHSFITYGCLPPISFFSAWNGVIS